MRLPAISLSLFLLIGCGGGSSDPIEVLVTDLATPDQILLCEDFLDLFCNSPGNETFCDDPCIDTGCQAVVENGDVDVECVGITDLDVLDCGEFGQPEDCADGPGCIADALVGACPAAN